MTGARSHSGTKTDKSQDHSPSVTQTARLPSKRRHKKPRTNRGRYPQGTTHASKVAADSQTKLVEFPRREDQDATSIEYRSDDVIKMKFVKLWDLLSYSERKTSKTPTRQKLAIRGKLSLRY